MAIIAVILLQTVLCVLGIWICNLIWLKPSRIKSILSNQGIKGPKPHFLYGNIQQMHNIQMDSQPYKSHDPISHSAWAFFIFPYLHRWSQRFGTYVFLILPSYGSVFETMVFYFEKCLGKVYNYSTGNKQHLYIGEADLIKAINLHNTLDIGKPKYLSKPMEPMLGNGIIRANGTLWLNYRKLIAPQFFLNKAKQNLGVMEESTTEIIGKWNKEIERQGGLLADITVDKDLKTLSADVISKACFGSSYSQGKEIFAKLEALQEAMSQPNVLFGLTNLSFLPTKSNRKIWRLQKEVDSLILEVVKFRGESEKSENDLLQALLESVANDQRLLQSKGDRERFIVDNCKNIYFAGHDTTAIAASWILMLLALHPEWQERVRHEILHISAGNLHDCLMDLDKLRLFRTLTMVIHESLRLYGPAVLTSREVFSDIKLGDLTIPKGTNIWILIIALHRDRENWGSDADEFKPERFANGIREACKDPQSYIPFGLGSRLCLGQTFAILELKILLALVLCSFSFSISPEYRHSPVYRMLLKPEHGIKLLVKKEQGTIYQK